MSELVLLHCSKHMLTGEFIGSVCWRISGYISCRSLEYNPKSKTDGLYGFERLKTVSLIRSRCLGNHVFLTHTIVKMLGKVHGFLMIVFASLKVEAGI